MTIAFDSTNGATAGTGNLSYTHTPVGTLKAVVCFVVQNVGITDEVSSVTYGGVAMTELPLSPLIHSTGSEDGVLYGYFLGSSIPTGPQTVEVTVNGTGSTKNARTIGFTGSSDCRVEDTTALDSGGVADPSVTLTIAHGECILAAVIHSGQNAPGSITAGTNMASFFGTFDFGNQAGGYGRSTTLFTTDAAIGFTSTTEEAGVLGVAVREILITGAAALAGTGTLAPTGFRTRIGDATLTGSGAISAAGDVTSPVVEGEAELAGSGDISATGVRTRIGESALAGSGTVSATGEHTGVGQVAVVGTGTVSASGFRTRAGDATLAGSGTVSASGVRIVTGAAALVGAGSVSADGAHTGVGQATFSGTGTISAAAEEGGVVIGEATLTGSGAVSATGVRTRIGSATLEGTGSVTIQGVRTTFAAVTLTGTGALIAVGVRARFGQAAIVGAGTVSASSPSDFQPPTGPTTTTGYADPTSTVYAQLSPATNYENETATTEYALASTSSGSYDGQTTTNYEET